jgi:hypothetical protein
LVGLDPTTEIIEPLLLSSIWNMPVGPGLPAAAHIHDVLRAEREIGTEAGLIAYAERRLGALEAEEREELFNERSAPSVFADWREEWIQRGRPKP